MRKIMKAAVLKIDEELMGAAGAFNIDQVNLWFSPAKVDCSRK